MKKLPRHQDVDSKILDVDKPMGLFWTVTLAGALFIILSAWGALVGLWAAGWIAFNGWHYLWLPMLALAGFLLIPTAFMLSKISWSILNMMAMTVEAWAARAGYSIDINRDGHIGYYEVGPPLIEEVAPPVTWNSPQGTKLLAKDADNVIGAASADLDPAEVVDDTPPRRRLIALGKPGKEVMVPAETIEQVMVEIVEAGKVLGRKNWVPKRLERDVFDGIMALLVRGRIITGRGKGSAGKLAVTDLNHARRILGGVLGPVGGQLASQARPTSPNQAASQVKTS
jgi:hypothetical protein